MSYASKQDMIDRFSESEMIQLTDRAGAGVIDDAVLNVAMAESDAEIDAYLQARYALPLTSVPLLIGKLARDLTRFYLYDDNPPESVSERYKAAVKTLELIARGTMQLGLDAASQPLAATAMPETRADAPVFDTASLATYK